MSQPPRPVRDVTSQVELCALGRHSWHVCDRPECSERSHPEMFCVHCGETKRMVLEWPSGT